MPTGGGSVYTGTATLSTGKTISSAGQVPAVYAGVATLSRHPSISSSGTYVPRTYWTLVRRQSKPIPGVAIDWSHPLARNLRSFHAINEGAGPRVNDQTGNGLMMTTVGSPTWSSGGLSCTSSGNYANVSIPTTNPLYGATLPLTIAVGLRHLANPAGTCIFCGLVTNGGSTALLDLFTTTTFTYQIGVSGVAYNSMIPLQTGKDAVLVVSVTKGGVATLYLNGQAIYSVSASSPTWTGVTYSSIGSEPAVVQNPNAIFNFYAVWNQSFTAADAASISANPWQIFQPIRLAMTPTPPAWSGTATVTTSHATASMSGTAATPTYSGAATISRHPAMSSSATSAVPVYAGTVTVSRHPTIVSSGALAGTYTGSASLSRHPTFAASQVLVFTGSASLSRHPTFAASQVLVFTGTATLTIRHPLIPIAAATPLSVYYPMDTIASGLSPDAMEEHDGTLSGDISLSSTVPAVLFPDPGSYALNQTGTNGQVQLNYPLGNMWTIATWLRPTSLATTGAIATNDQGNGLYVYNGTLAYRSAGTMSTTAALTANVWQHVAVSYYFGQITAYLNGAYAGSPAAGTFTLTNIGSNSGGQAFQGLMDDFRCYSTNLTTQQIQSLYQGKQDTPNMAGVFSFRTTGTATLSRHPNISASAVYYNYLGAMTASRHPTLTAAATRVVPVYSGATTLSRHPTFASAARSVAYVGASSLAVRHPAFAGTATSALPFARVAMNCFLKADPIPTFSGNVTLTAVGFSVTASGGGFAATTLYAGGVDNPPYARLNLWAGGYQPPLWVSAVLNLSAASGYPVADGSVLLYAENLAAEATAYTTLYAAGQGVTPGAVPASASVNMAVQRGPYAGITLFLQQNGTAATLPMFAIGSPSETASVPLFAIGDGGDAVATLTLVVPLASTPTAAANQVTLAAPNVVGTAAGTQLLYTQGWRS